MITAVDIGATKTLVAQFNNAGKIETDIRFETPQNQSEFYAELASTLHKLADVSVLSVGVPGIVDSLGVVKRCGRLTWQDFDLKGMLAKDFHGQVFIENDAKMAALAEANALSPVPPLCLYLTISTGIGEGVVQEGKLVSALKYSEAGHMMFLQGEEWKTWQDIVSGRQIKAHFGKMARDLTDPKDWQWVSENLALGLLALVPTIQPDTVIFGGSVGRFFDKFGGELTAILNKRLPKYIKRPVLVGARHPDEAVIYGCYFYANHQQDL